MSLTNIRIYKTKSGKAPYIKWRDDLDTKTRSTVLARIDRVSLGNFGDCTQIKSGGGIWELVIDYGPGYRIYFGKHGINIVVLLLGGNKSSQGRDIDKAKRYWLEYKESLDE